MTPLAAYVLLFLAVGVGFIFVHLLAGHFIRPSKKNPEKDTIYECGEPTIGSAWVQFDLRFYVVALLFVIFDVEVAFFFPWAEIFGKANAIRSAKEPTTLEEQRELAAKVNDLVSPAASTSGLPITRGMTTSVRERALWKKLEMMSQEEADAYKLLKGDNAGLTAVLLSLARGRRGDDVRALTADQLEVIRKQADAIDKAIQKVIAEQSAELGKSIKAFQGLPADQQKDLARALIPPALPGMPPPDATGVEGLVKTLLARPAQLDTALRAKRLIDLQAVSRTEFDLRPPTAAARERLVEMLPERAKALPELANRHRQEVITAANSALAALTAAGPQQKGLWQELSPNFLKEVGSLSSERLEALRTLTPEGLEALETPLLPDAQQGANKLAWLAMVDILVFFGVLLVGFAYLWRRGDLAWVRSTAAEQVNG